MCVVDLVESALTSGLARRHFLGASIAGGLAASTVGWGRALMLPGLAEGAVPPSSNPDVFVKELKQSAPKAQVAVMKYFESFAP